MKKERVVEGENLFLIRSEEVVIPYPLGLYLGEDTEGEKVLYPTYSEGWSIISLSDLPCDFRSKGLANISECYVTGKEVRGYKYIYFSNKNQEVVTIMKVNGKWCIMENTAPPSWTL